MTDKAKDNYRKLSEIADRALNNEYVRNLYQTKFPLILDITYTDKIIPLNLEKLLESSEYDFFHDITGIYGNFNRQTKQMENEFIPRCAR